MPHPPSDVRQHTLADAEHVLRAHWGFDRFRPGQREAVESVLERRDTLAVLPTGGGKSVCYQVPAMLGGLVVVVSPLIALMRDQVAGLNARGIPATFLDSTLSYRETEQRWTDAEFGRYRLLYLAPERMESERFLARAERLPTSLLAVDEAHCISEWGHDFRPAYLRLGEAAEALGRPPILAVTATATPEVRRDIVRHLGMEDSTVVVRGFDRPNVVPSVLHVEDKAAKVLDVLASVGGSAIAYAGTRRNTEAWAERLQRASINAAAYHAGLPSAKRSDVQERWQRGALRVVVATSAFGMGIDKPDVRLVLHVDLPPTLEAYYQEIGRAGRDGGRSYAALLTAPGDERAARSFAEEGHPDARTVQEAYAAACSLAQLPLGSEPDGPMAIDPVAVADSVGCSALRARSAVEVLARAGVWDLVPPHPHRGLVRFLQPAERVRSYADELGNDALARFVRTLLRSVHAEAFSGWSDMDLRALERRTALGRERLLRGLEFLASHEILAYHPPGDGLRVIPAGPRTPSAVLDVAALERARERASTRLDDVLRYTRAVTCRRHFLLGYFGERSPAHCGTCDVCLGRHRPTVITPQDEPALLHLLRHIADGGAAETGLEATETRRLLGLLDWLLFEGYVAATDPLAATYALTEKGERRLSGITERG